MNQILSWEHEWMNETKGCETSLLPVAMCSFTYQTKQTDGASVVDGGGRAEPPGGNVTTAAETFHTQPAENKKKHASSDSMLSAVT